VSFRHRGLSDAWMRRPWLVADRDWRWLLEGKETDGQGSRFCRHITSGIPQAWLQAAADASHCRAPALKFGHSHVHDDLIRWF
jgi:hypothetical protein